MTSGTCGWRLTEPTTPDGDAVEFALGLESAKLICGPFTFDFARAPDSSGGVTLALRRDGAAHVAGPLGLLDQNEQFVPRAPERLSAERRKSLEARYLRVLGRTLFDDVARLVQLETEYQ